MVGSKYVYGAALPAFRAALDDELCTHGAALELPTAQPDAVDRRGCSGKVERFAENVRGSGVPWDHLPERMGRHFRSCHSKFQSLLGL